MFKYLALHKAGYSLAPLCNVAHCVYRQSADGHRVILSYHSHIGFSVLDVNWFYCWYTCLFEMYEL